MIKMKIKDILKNSVIFEIITWLFPIRGKRNRVVKDGLYNKVRLYIKGNDNVVVFKKNTRISNLPITIIGNNNIVEIEENVKILNRHNMSDILMVGNNCKLIIGYGTSIQSAHINVQEDNSSIVIGENCMFSEDIIIRTSDSHSILDKITGRRINKAKDVKIGNHVWIAARACILKGVTIYDNSIVGVGSIVTRDVPPNVIVAGNPAIVRKESINWNSILL